MDVWRFVSSVTKGSVSLTHSEVSWREKGRKREGEERKRERVCEREEREEREEKEKLGRERKDRGRDIWTIREASNVVNTVDDYSWSWSWWRSECYEVGGLVLWTPSLGSLSPPLYLISSACTIFSFLFSPNMIWFFFLRLIPISIPNPICIPDYHHCVCVCICFLLSYPCVCVCRWTQWWQGSGAHKHSGEIKEESVGWLWQSGGIVTSYESTHDPYRRMRIKIKIKMGTYIKM